MVDVIMNNIKIQNLVATTPIAENLDLELFHQIMSGTEYDPAIFPGLIFRLKELGTTMLLFKSGQVVCTGGKDVEDVNRSIRTLVKILREANFEVNKNPNITIQNIVATCDLGVGLNLISVGVGLGLENVEYEPEQFPGLVYRIDEPKTVLLLFQTGKVVCTGAKHIEDIELAINKLKDKLNL
jgi:transcription initiation factor TFIID TATA-box-binding protein